MSYTSTVPMYVVTLPCGHEFRSVTRVVTNMGDTSAFGFTDDEDPEDITWLFCRTCDKNYALEGWELEEYQAEPRDSVRSALFPNGRLLGEKRLQRMYNEAVIKDRVAAVLLKTQGAVSLPQVVANLASNPEIPTVVSLRTVENVADDLRALSKYPTTEETPKAAKVVSLRLDAVAA